MKFTNAHRLEVDGRDVGHVLSSGEDVVLPSRPGVTLRGSSLDAARDDPYFLEALFSVWRRSSAGLGFSATTVDVEGFCTAPREVLAFRWTREDGLSATYLTNGLDLWGSVDGIVDNFRTSDGMAAQSVQPVEPVFFDRLASVGLIPWFLHGLEGIARRTARAGGEPLAEWRDRMFERPWSLIVQINPWGY